MTEFMSRQFRWMWCNRCQGLAYADSWPDAGACADGYRHDHAGSGNYLMFASGPVEDEHEQEAGWRGCANCWGLYYAGNGSAWQCFAGGDQAQKHAQQGNLDYVLAKDPAAPDSSQQGGWKRCTKCQCLTFTENETPGPCPAGDEHDTGASPTYFLTLTTAEGYAVPKSAAPGELIEFHVSAGDPYTVTYMLLGIGGGPETQPVGMPFDVDSSFYDTPDQAYSNGCGWETSFSLQVPDDWAPGMYAAQLSNDSGEPGYIVFVVKPALVQPNRIAVLSSTNTWNAYNNWGGRSKYTVPAATTLSFERPDSYATPIDDYIIPKHRAVAELWIIGWLGAAGYQVDVYTDYDFHKGIPDLQSYGALLLNTHSEYWTDQMLDNLQAYLDQGGCLVNLSGNSLFEQVELSVDGTTMTARGGSDFNTRANYIFSNLGRPPRTILGVGYRDDSRTTFAPFEVRVTDHSLMSYVVTDTGVPIAVHDRIGTTTLGSDGSVSEGVTTGDGGSGWRSTPTTPVRPAARRRFSSSR